MPDDFFFGSFAFFVLSFLPTPSLAFPRKTQQDACCSNVSRLFFFEKKRAFYIIFANTYITPPTPRTPPPPRERGHTPTPTMSAPTAGELAGRSETNRALLERLISNTANIIRDQKKWFDPARSGATSPSPLGEGSPVQLVCVVRGF